MKTIYLLAILAIFTACDKTIAIKNNIATVEDITIAMKNVKVLYYVGDNLAGEVAIDSIANGKKSERFIVPDNIDYVKVITDFVRQNPDTTLKGMWFDYTLFKDKRHYYKINYYIPKDDNSFDVVITENHSYITHEK